MSIDQKFSYIFEELDSEMKDIRKSYEVLKTNKTKECLAVIHFLKESLGEDFWKWFENAKLHGNWYTHNGWHFSGGMNVRNHLRQNGYGEAYLGIDNLDDTYTFLIEDAYGMRLYEATLSL